MLAASPAPCSQRALPHVPVVDEQRKVVGMVTQSDLLVALYKSIALGQASQAAKL